MLLDFVVGVPGDKVLARDENVAPSVLGDLGKTLACLHQVSWPADRKLRDVRQGYPVCNTGDLLKGESLEQIKKMPSFAQHEFVTFVHSRLTWLQELYSRDVPWGLIHGDAFLDNTLYKDCSADGVANAQLLALVDWEDSCVGPFVLDLAVSASACCFTASNELIKERLVLLLQAYEAQRPLSSGERSSFVDFMAAGALACAFYRFSEFNVNQPESDAQAKDSWRIMFDRTQRLETAEVRDIILSAFR
eukprot:gnl/TRDRNA2_/TRDRNA2_137177_c0_seq2.p1 gnl/TRDRNA2_/TRDRNA2_137177_c0~~gnl/TRDRNA2_/TRDRNA2_137177_c0_seq2.p1  ORF type:complete len:248 (+),score=43.52 gnl/TRDRNA2_/TRDRNA2_137177_c0_seq2:301-1044(+)